MAPFAAANLGLQVFGMISGGIGAKYQAQMQKDALAHNAQMDVLNARSSALSLTGQADLEALNAQSVYNTSLVGAEFAKFRADYESDNATIKAEYQAGRMETEAAMRAESTRAHTQADLTRAAGSAAAAELSAQGDELQARLNELQAQYMTQVGIYKEQDTRQQFAQAKSKARARMAAGNIDLGQGAALQVAAAADVMAENAAIRIQQETLMSAYGQRVAAQGNLMSAQGKRIVAGANMAAASMSAASANANAAANLVLARGEANYLRATTAANADFTRGMANAEFTATSALAAAGLLSANASIDYKRGMADVMLNNASAAAMVKSTMADGINPNMAMMTSLLGSAGHVANSWYQYSKTTSRP